MKFTINKISGTSSLRTGAIETPRGIIQTPIFMPVGTVGAVKTVAPWELRELGAEIILGNTYHLYLRPGEKLIEKFGGLAEFNRWRGPILTDSGGFQVFSLGGKKQIIDNEKRIVAEKYLIEEKSQKARYKFQTNFKSQKTEEFSEKKSLVKITDGGVEFKSYLDGSSHYFTPEKVIGIQLALGSDIIMPLDVCPPSKAPKAEVKKAVELSIKWLKRSKKHLDQKKMKDEPAFLGLFKAVFTRICVNIVQKR